MNIANKGNNQEQFIVAGFEVSLHGGNSISHHAQANMPVWGALMFDQRVYVTVTLPCFKGIQYIRVVGA